MNKFRISDFGFRNENHPSPNSSPLRGEGWVRGNPQSAIRNPQSAFTLLEVMVAVAILATVLVTLLGVKNRSMQDVMLAEHITTATLLAKREMTDTILRKPLLQNEEEGEFTEEEFEDYTWKKTVAPSPIEQTIMEVRVAVLWKEGERQETVELVSYE